MMEAENLDVICCTLAELDLERRARVVRTLSYFLETVRLIGRLDDGTRERWHGYRWWSAKIRMGGAADVHGAGLVATCRRWEAQIAGVESRRHC